MLVSTEKRPSTRGSPRLLCARIMVIEPPVAVAAKRT